MRIYEFSKNYPRIGVFRNVKLSNLGNVLQRNLTKDRAGSAFLEHLEAQIFRPGTNHGSALLKILFDTNEGVKT